MLGSETLRCVRGAGACALLCFAAVLRGSARRGRVPADLVPAVSGSCCASCAFCVSAAARLLKAMLVSRMLPAACLAVRHLDCTAVLKLAICVVALRLVVAEAECLLAMRDLQVLHGSLQLLYLVLVNGALRPVRAIGFACLAGALSRAFGRAWRCVGCVRCGRHCWHTGPRLHESGNVAANVRHLMQCFVEAEPLFLDERCDAAPELAVCVEHLLGADVAKPMAGLPNLRALLADFAVECF